MAINPEIALGVRPFVAPQLDIPSPVEQFGKVLTLQNLMQQRQAGALQLENQQLQLQQARQQAQERADLGKYLQDLRSGSNTGAAGPGGASAAPAFDYGEIMRRFPTLGPGIVKAHHDAATAGYDEQLKQIDITQKQTARRAQLAGSITDEATKTAAIAQALQEGLVTPAQRDQLLQLPFDNPQWKQFQTQALNADQQLTQARQAAEEGRAKVKFAHDQVMFPSQETEAKAKAAEAVATAAQAQRSQDAMTLAGALRQGPQAYADALNGLPADRRQPFAGAKTETDLLRAAMKPAEIVTATEQQRHNLSSEATARLNASIAAGRLAQERIVNGLKYGPGTAEYWVQQLHENPDSIKEMPPELRSTVGQSFTKQYGLPLPTPLGDTAKATETAARTALDAAAFIRNAMQDPEIKARIGPIMGRLGDKEQDAGATVGLSPAAAAKAQELRTRMRYFVFQEGKAVLGGRMPQNLMSQLESSSANVHMEPGTLEGALRGAEGAATSTMENLDKQRFGGKSRGGGSTAPAAGGGHVIEINGKHYQYKGTGATDDLSNYNEVK